MFKPLCWMAKFNWSPTVHLGFAADRSNVCCGTLASGDPITFPILFLIFFKNKVSSICWNVESMRPKDFCNIPEERIKNAWRRFKLKDYGNKKRIDDCCNGGGKNKIKYDSVFIRNGDSIRKWGSEHGTLLSLGTADVFWAIDMNVDAGRSFFLLSFLLFIFLPF